MTFFIPDSLNGCDMYENFKLSKRQKTIEVYSGDTVDRGKAKWR